MRTPGPALFAFVSLLLWPAPAVSKVINVEFKFTPFIGDTAKDEVETVPGHARVYVNGIPIADETVEKHAVPVLFDEREVAAAVWVSMESLGSAVRRGKNSFRIEFEPSIKGAYQAQLRWAFVNDETTTTGGPGRTASTNQSNEGVESKSGPGKVVLEKEFTADFVSSQPWHSYPPIDALTEEDKKALAALVADRVRLFAPDFSSLYAVLKQNRALDVEMLRSQKCLEKAHAAGVRIAATDAGKMRFSTTGSAAVVVEGGERGLYAPADVKSFDKIKGDEAQMCASAALFNAFPPRLVAVRAPGGSWEAAP